VNLLNGVELQRSELRAFREGMRADFAEFRVEMQKQSAASELSDLSLRRATARLARGHPEILKPETRSRGLGGGPDERSSVT
jgi:hypothetical protein